MRQRKPARRLRPKLGLGLDISEGMVGRAKAQHPNLEFQISDSIHFNARKKYDFVVISDTVNDLWDVQATLTASSRCLKAEGRLIINFYSRLWELPLKIATRLHLAKPTLLQNWLTPDDARNLLDLAGYEVIRHWEEVLLPLPIPLLAPLCNKYLVRFWPFRMLAMTTSWWRARNLSTNKNIRARV